MAYGKLAEGARVFTAVAGPAASADINEIQDQLYAMLGPRRLKCTAFNSAEFLPGGSTAASFPTIYAPLGRAGADDYCYIHIPVYVGQVITEVGVEVTGTTGATAGAIEFLYRSAGSSAFTAVDLDGVANCWDTGGTAYGNAVTYSSSAAPFPLTIATATEVMFRLTASSNPGASDCYVWEAYVIAQFGN